jgi:hypothetical protein
MGLRIRSTALKELSFEGRARTPLRPYQSHSWVGGKVRSATMISLQK